MATLGDRLAARARERFAGRERELEVAARLLDGDGATVLWLHGPGGIGKTSLLREVLALAQARGFSPFVVDGRDVPPAPAALDEALCGALAAERPLVALDTFERMAPAAAHLRDVVLPALPADGVVVIASREPPGDAWTRDGWDVAVRELALGPLDDAEAAALLDRAGVEDGERRRAIVAWADGLPLALTLGADATRDALRPPAEELADRAVLDRLTRRVVEAELDGAWSRPLAVAAIARVVTVELLGDVLADGTEADAYAWLASRSFVEPHGTGLGLHALVARAVAADLREVDPELERDLRRRIVDHLHAAALRDGLIRCIDLAHLLEDPLLRWGFSWQGSDRYRADGLRMEDVEVLERRVARRGLTNWWARTEQLHAEAPSSVVVVRDRDGQPVGVATFVTPFSAPPAAEADPELGRWLAHARAGDDPRAVVWRESLDLTGSEERPAQALLGLAAVLRSGLPNVRYAYLPINPHHAAAVVFAKALGARHLPELDDPTGESPLQCWLCDYGPGGLLGMQRDAVYRELGLPAPGDGTEGAAGAGAVALDDLREALRVFHVPAELAQSPLASGDGIEARASAARARIAVAVDAAFGPTDEDRLLRDVLVAGYLEVGAGHEQAARALHLSRSAYFRRLRAAVERLHAAM